MSLELKDQIAKLRATAKLYDEQASEADRRADALVFQYIEEHKLLYGLKWKLRMEYGRVSLSTDYANNDNSLRAALQELGSICGDEMDGWYFEDDSEIAVGTYSESVYITMPWAQLVGWIATHDAQIDAAEMCQTARQRVKDTHSMEQAMRDCNISWEDEEDDSGQAE